MATFFNDSFREYAAKFITKEMKSNAFEKMNSKNTLKVIIAELCEQILLYDKVYLIMERSNLPLTILLSEIGPELLGDAISEGIIVPILWTNQMVTYSDKDRKGREKTPKDFPIIPCLLSSPEHCQPEASIINAFANLQVKISKDEQNTFMKRVAGNYYFPKISSDHAVKTVIDAYQGNHLSKVGLPFEQDAYLLNDYKRMKLLSLSGEVLHTAFAAQHNVFLLSSPSQFVMATSSASSIGNALKLQDNFDEISKQESIPQLRDLFLDKVLDFNGALNLRRSGNAGKFRNWISQTEANKETIMGEYVNDIRKEKGYFEGNKAKYMKFGVMQLLGAGIGKIAENPLIGTAAGTIAGFGLNAFDSFILDGLKIGWAPQRFVADIKKVIRSYQ